MVSVILANNEVGTLNPISDISKWTARHGVRLHTDAAQAVGHVPVRRPILGGGSAKFHGS